MSGDNIRLAGFLRLCQWHCDEAAFALGGGRFGTDRCRELAAELFETAIALRRYADSHDSPPKPALPEGGGAEHRTVESDPDV
ncbi:hypothetical protein SAMN04487905_101480 [Actinopolyspora xinjiangensis]|uniref:Uncharacterized protein n=1 Tax=Actinopolyspora xinjiangensis TaxID=405564 RepID=A0A1H0PCZ0_9ACTN|nr:hypothetical protein [Actinopolyspora xinjiangensis]SDP02476.1 hypothetical protein SAMN04487905_101480 [Actinopolyspora xinjiangensis]